MTSGFHSPRRYEQGVALVIVLAFVVLLAGLIVAYFSRTMTDRQLSNSSFNQASADAMAKSALDIITSDLKQELLKSGSASVIGNTTIYVDTEVSPVRNGTPSLVMYSGALPMFAGSGTYPLPTLLRTSSNSPIPTPGVDHAASNAPSSGTSANGRSISLARWNQHYLLPRQNPAGATLDPTPVSSGGTGFTAPSWVYVTGTGGPAVPPLTSPISSVIGRYAYAIYDEGALLDMNAAGYPCMSGTIAPYVSGTVQQAMYGGKGALAFADIAVLSSGSGLPVLSTTNVNSIVGWRNYATLNSAGVDIGAFPSFTTLPAGGTATAAKYYSVITSNTNGLLQVSGTAYNNQTDQAFLSRQQLINLMTRSSITTMPGASLAALQNALQYMGTFSRAVTAPSWCPISDAGDMTNPALLHPGPTGTNGASNIYAYKTQSETMGYINRDLANVRFPSSGISITHYGDNGTSTRYLVQKGDPYLQRRFSLARLGWLTHTGPASGMTQAVSDCFGLQWGQDAYGNPCWMYIHGTIPNQTTAQTGGGTTTGNQILTLDQVAALGREPDFFELLKAGILNGSLGRDPGPTNVSGTNHGVAQGCGGIGFEKTSIIADAQIIQIGANIIDQYDSDSYPTAIFFQGNNYDDISVPEKGPLNVFYGIENLPYLYQMRPVNWYIMNPDYTGYNSWYQPELWNPFQAPTVTTNRPVSFMVQAYGAVQLRIGSSSGIVLYEKVSPQWNYDLDPYAQESFVYFKDPLASGTSFFSNPQMLTGNYEDTSVATTPVINKAPASGSPQAPYDSATYNPFLAIHAGFSPYQITTSSTAPDHTCTWVKDIPPGGGFVNPKVTPQSPPAMGVTFCLKYYDAVSAKFLPYTYLSRWVDVYGDAYGVSGSNAGAPTDRVWGASKYTQTQIMRADPLTDRFSANTIDGSHGPGFLAANQTWQNSSAPGSPGELDLSWPVSGGFYYNGGGCTNGVPNWPTPPTKGYNYQIESYLGAWAQNLPLGGANEAYYADPDGIVRPGNDCAYTRTGAGTIGDGLSQAANGYSTTSGVNTNGATSNSSHTMNRRPLVLNRPFRSVGELGYAYRDLPFKSLDFFTSYSADAALLDMFSVNDQPSIVAGQVNPNNAPPPVLQAILSGAGKQEADPTYNLNAEVTTSGSNMAAAIAGYLQVSPLRNRADLVSKLGLVMSGTGTPVVSGTTSVFRNGYTASKNKIGDQADKITLEAPVRALADVTNTRTWNLMIDVIAQTGAFPPNATDLNRNFVVQGERRYWLHIAIDRFTGKVVDQQLEPVYE